MKTLLPVALIAGFIWLAAYSQRHVHDADDRLAQEILTSMPKLDPVKPHTHWKTKRASALADVWQLTEADARKPINLWGSK